MVKQDRVLGDEWLDWQGDEASNEIREGKRTFLLLSVVVMLCLISIIVLFWYLVLPRFEQYGTSYVILLTVSVAAVLCFLIVWYVLLFFAVISKNSYLNICLRKRSNLFFFLFPMVLRIARSLGISKDRLSHSFIKVSNILTPPPPAGQGQVLALLPRCLKKELRRKAEEMVNEYRDVIMHTAPGGNVARKIINETCPRAIVAVACERDLVNGIHEISPKIPVIGIPNSRPVGPCKDTSIDLEELRSALNFFSTTQ